MSCSHRSYPSRPAAARHTLDGPCARIRRIFVPCPLMRAQGPANDNPPKPTPFWAFASARPLWWIGFGTLLLGAAGAGVLS